MRKKDFKELISHLKQIRLKAKRSIKQSLHPKYKKEYPLDFQISDSENRGKVFVCNKVLNELEKIIKNSLLNKL